VEQVNKWVYAGQPKSAAITNTWKHELIYSYCLSFDLYNRCSLISMFNELMLCIWEKTQVDLLILSVIWSLWVMKPWEKIIEDLLIMSVIWSLWLIHSCYAYERKHKVIYSYCLSFNLYDRCSLISMINELMLCIWEKTQGDLLILSVIWSLWLINSCYVYERKHKLIYSYCLSFDFYDW
jgi:hypothetical protein